MRYETDSNRLKVASTQNGYLSKMMLKGKTLVNISEINSKTINYGGMIVKTSKTQLKPNTTYTQIVNIKSNTLSPGNEINAVGVINESASGVLFGQFAIPKDYVGIVVKKATAPSDLSSITSATSMRSYSVTTSGSLVAEEIILEGDYTQNPPSHFEGLKSVGDGVDNIVVSSLNENRFNFDNIVKVDPGLTYEILDSNSIKVTKPKTQGTYANADFQLYLEPNQNYEISAKFKDYNGIPLIGIKRSDGTHVTDLKPGIAKANFAPANGIIDLRFMPNSGVSEDGYATYYDICVKKVEYANNPYTPTKRDKKILLYKDKDGVWKKPILRSAGAIIDLIDGDKKKFYKRCGEYVTTGLEPWVLNGTYDKFIEFVGSAYNVKNSTCVCDKLNYNTNIGISNETNPIGIRTLDNGFRVKPLTKKDMTFAEGVDWIKGNPLTIVHALAQEEVYDCVAISVASFTGDTEYSVESGAISPNSNFELDYTLSNAVTRVSDAKVFNEAMNDNLKYNLKEKGVEVVPGTKMSSLVDKVGDISQSPFPAWAFSSNYAQMIRMPYNPDKYSNYVQHDGLVFGSYAISYNNNVISQYDMYTNTYTPRVPIQTALMQYNTCVIGDYLYYIDGSSNIYRYNTVTQTNEKVLNDTVLEPGISIGRSGKSLLAKPTGKIGYMYNLETLTREILNNVTVEDSIRGRDIVNTNDGIYIIYFAGSEMYAHANIDKFNINTKTSTNITSYSAGNVSNASFKAFYASGYIFITNTTPKNHIFKRYDIAKNEFKDFESYTINDAANITSGSLFMVDKIVSTSLTTGQELSYMKQLYE